jgi:hypothetical protein
LTSKVENYGHSDSEPQEILLYKNVKGSDKREVVKKIKVPRLKPYAVFDLREELSEFDKDKIEYQLIVPGSPREYWRRVDISDPRLKYEGDWKTVKGTEGAFMNAEITSVNPGDRINFTFEGTRAIVYGRVLKQGAYTMQATLDGEALGPVRAAFHNYNSVKILQTPLLNDGRHTLVLENTGKNPVFINSFAYESVQNLHGFNN